MIDAGPAMNGIATGNTATSAPPFEPGAGSSLAPSPRIIFSETDSRTIPPAT